MQNNKVIAIWGSPNSGKTLLSVKLANLLSQGKKDVALIFCDPHAPILPVILPQLDAGEKSLGKILSAPEITQDIILSNCVTMKKNGYLTFMGYRKGENSLNYPNYVNDKAVDLIIQLRHLADYTIIDCISYFTTDILSNVALEKADSVITLGGCRLKDLSCFASLLPILQNNKYNQDRHIRVLSNHRINDPIAEYKEMYRNIMFELPNIPELEQQFAEGDILESLATAEGRSYENTIRLIAKEAFNG